MLPSFDHFQGNDRDYDFAVVDAQGNPENITGWTFWFTVKVSAADDDPGIFQLTSTDGGIVVDVAAQGLGRILVRRQHTRDVPPGAYWCDLQCRKGLTTAPIETLASAVFKILPRITRAE